MIEESSRGRPHVLLGVTGSVAAILTPKLILALQEIGEVRVIMTEAAKYFWQPNDTSVVCLSDADAWPGQTYHKDQPVLHVTLGDWADVLVIAPLTANTLNKLMFGIADNLLTCTYYAWPPTKPIIVAPAMNTRMWENDFTRQNIVRIRRSMQNTVVTPIAKQLVCGTYGEGAMAQVETIAQAVAAKLANH